MGERVLARLPVAQLHAFQTVLGDRGDAADAVRRLVEPELHALAFGSVAVGLALVPRERGLVEVDQEEVELHCLQHFLGHGALVSDELHLRDVGADRRGLLVRVLEVPLDPVVERALVDVAVPVLLEPGLDVLDEDVAVMLVDVLLDQANVHLFSGRYLVDLELVVSRRFWVLLNLVEPLLCRLPANLRFLAGLFQGHFVHADHLGHRVQLCLHELFFRALLRDRSRNQDRFGQVVKKHNVLPVFVISRLLERLGGLLVELLGQLSLL